MSDRPPPPCPKCGSIERQKYTWSGHGEYRQVCQDCGNDTGWKRWPPKRIGWDYRMLGAVNATRNAKLVRLADELRHAAKLATHCPPLRDRLADLADEVDACRVWSLSELSSTAGQRADADARVERVT